MGTSRVQQIHQTYEPLTDLIYPEAVAVDILGMLRLDGVEFPAGGGCGEQRCDEELAESVQPAGKGPCVHVEVLHIRHHKSR